MGGRAEVPVIAIDFGTTKCCVAVWHKGRVEIVPNEYDNRTTPSVVAFTDNGCLIGEAALDQINMNPTNTIFDIKRLIGTRYIKNDKKLWPFEVVVDTSKPLIEVYYGGEVKRFTLEEIYAMVLRKMKKMAETFLLTPVKNVVITVPTYFNDSQRQATKNACSIAGLNVLCLINEPIAAAMAYGFDTIGTGSSRVSTKNVLIFDLGGGTFDVSLLTIDRGECKVETIRGDTHLGGGDFDNRMVEFLLEELPRKHKIGIRKKPKALGRLRNASELAKRVLSLTTETSVELECLFKGIDFSSKITRATFEKINVDLFEKCMDIVNNCLRDANMETSDVHDIVLVGGSTLIPKIRYMLGGLFNGKELYSSVNPNEVVAYGAALHAATLPFSVDNCDGRMTFVIPSNSSILVSETQGHETTLDNQTTTIRLFNNNRLIAEQNNHLGQFNISLFPAKTRGKTKFEICFDIDDDSVVHLNVMKRENELRNQFTEVTNEQKEKLLNRTNKSRKVEAMKALETYTNAVSNVCNDAERIKSIGVMLKRMMKDAINETFEWLEKNRYSADASMFQAKLEELRDICGDIATL